MYHNQHILYYVETAVDQVLIWFFLVFILQIVDPNNVQVWKMCIYKWFTNAFTGWKEPQWVILSSLLIKGGLGSGSMQRCLLYDWPSQTVWLNSLESLIQEYHLEKFPIQAFLPGNKQTNKQETLLSKYLVHFQNWMFDCLFIYFLLFILAALTAELVRSIWIKIAIEANCTVWILDFRSTFTIWL